MPLSLDVTAMVTNQWYPLATSTSEDYITLRNPNPSTPVLVQFASTVATALSDATGASTSKIPAGPGPVYSIRIKDGITIFVQNASTTGVILVAKLAP